MKRTLEVAEPRARFLYEPLSESKIKQQGLWGGSVSVPSVLVYFQCILDDLMPILRPFVKELDGGGITTLIGDSAWLLFPFRRGKQK